MAPETACGDRRRSHYREGNGLSASAAHTGSRRIVTVVVHGKHRDKLTLKRETEISEMGPPTRGGDGPRLLSARVGARAAVWPRASTQDKHVPEPDGGDRHKSECGWHSGTADSDAARVARSEEEDSTTSKNLGEQELRTGSRH